MQVSFLICAQFWTICVWNCIIITVHIGPPCRHSPAVLRFSTWVVKRRPEFITRVRRVGSDDIAVFDNSESTLLRDTKKPSCNDCHKNRLTFDTSFAAPVRASRTFFFQKHAICPGIWTTNPVTDHQDCGSCTFNHLNVQTNSRGETLTVYLPTQFCFTTTVTTTFNIFVLFPSQHNMW